MKDSAVLQGLRAWASKLHPQLPLNPRESNRLLTALTGSFRQHLDESHPLKAGEEGKNKPAIGGVSKTTAYAMHSSTALTDKHLASVLMNPLLTKGSRGIKKADQDFANAQIALQKDPARDPISLLEEYHEKGIATVPIARLCLEVFKKSIADLPKDGKQKASTEVEPGRRVLLWLWKSEQYKHAAFVDDRTFIELLVPMLMDEGHEKYIWDWIRLDQVLADDNNTYRGIQIMFHRYRWKGRLLREMVVTKLEIPGRELKSADAALDLHFKACNLKTSAPKGDHMRYLPLGHAAGALSRALTKFPATDFRCTDPDRYDRFIDTLEYSKEGNNQNLMRTRASLHLSHPSKPTAQPMLRFLQHCFHDQSLTWCKYAASLRQPSAETASMSWYSSMTATMARLQLEGCNEDASWLEENIWQVWPETARKDLKKDIQQHHDRLQSAPERHEASEDVPERTPFPTFG